MLVLLKLGGSLITDKSRPYSPRLDILHDLAEQVSASLQENDSLQILLGHGSGSFGHQAARDLNTRGGVAGERAWRGFSEVWYQASALDRLVVDAFHQVGLPVLAFDPVGIVVAKNRQVVAWDVEPIRVALKRGLLPVIFGQVVFDQTLGGTILSTEDLFCHLAQELHPQRILLAGEEQGVWEDFPRNTRILSELTPSSLPRYIDALGPSARTDVTGGMLAKVSVMLQLIEQIPDLSVSIFSGIQPGNVRCALKGENPGTLLRR